MKQKYELGETLYTITFNEKYAHHHSEGIPIYLGLDKGTVIQCTIVGIGINDTNVLVYEVKSVEDNSLYKRYEHALCETKEQAEQLLKKLQGEE